MEVGGGGGGEVVWQSEGSVLVIGQCFCHTMVLMIGHCNCYTVMVVIGNSEGDNKLQRLVILKSTP